MRLPDGWRIGTRITHEGRTQVVLFGPPNDSHQCSADAFTRLGVWWLKHRYAKLAWRQVRGRL